MSIRAMHWALNEAPVQTPTQTVILVVMAERADDDGTDTWQSVATIAKKSKVSERTVHRELRTMEEAGIIRRGDQQHVQHLPVNHRPTVWDLAVGLRGDNLSPLNKARGDIREIRGDTDDTLGVTLLADNTSLETSLKKRPKKSGAQVRRLSTFPDGFTLTKDQAGVLQGQFPHMDLMYEFQKFQDWANSKDARYKDWAAAFRNWCRRADTYVSSKQPPGIVSYGNVMNAGRAQREAEQVAREFYESEGIPYP